MRDISRSAMDSGSFGEQIRFGPYALDVKARRLSRNGEPVRLGTRAMDLLLAFIEQPGRLIAAEELMARAWPNSMVVQSNLRAQVAALRESLDKGGAGQRYIQNVPSRGYRFVCPLQGSDEPQPARKAAAADTPRPQPPQKLLGREGLAASVLDSLDRRRLVTITGQGGVGKTAFAAFLADAFAPRCSDGVHWIDLGPLVKEDCVAEAIALSVGLVNFTADPTPGIVAWLRDKQVLLVLDCCDRVVEGVSTLVERVASACPDARIIVTSREVLRAAGEYVVRLPALATPAEGEILTADQAMAYPAIQLFIERASAVLGGFVLQDGDAAHIATICQRVDGNPLAIELAAGHLFAISPGSLAALLDDRFRLLAVGRRTALERHKTMHAVLEWSFETLTGHERYALLSLAIFEGDTALPALRAVTDVGEISMEGLVQALSRLVDKSLITINASAAGPNYRLSDTTRAFALARLKDDGALDLLSERHAQFVLENLRRITKNNLAFSTSDGFMVRRRELTNIRAALNWAYSADRGRPLRLALSALAGRILVQLSLVIQCRRRMLQALEELASHETADPAVEMQLRALLAIASLYSPGPVPETVETLEKVVAIARGIHDEEHLAMALWGLWSVCIFQSQPHKALVYAEQFGAARADLSDGGRRMLIDRMAGMAAHLIGDQNAAFERLERVSTQFDPTLHGWMSLGQHIDHGLMARIYLARVLWLRGEPERALNQCQDCMEALVRQGHAIAQCHALFEVAIPLAYMTGRMDAAAAYLVRLKALSDLQGLQTFQAGALWMEMVFEAIRRGGDVFACRAAEQTLQSSYYEALGPWLSSLMVQEALHRGDIAAGVAWIEPYLAKGLASGANWWAAELLRLRGELAAAEQPEQLEAAQAYIRQAVDVARSQGALALELRALTSLTALQRRIDGGHDTERSLRDLIARFDQGFETADLLAARQLDALSAD